MKMDGNLMDSQKTHKKVYGQESLRRQNGNTELTLCNGRLDIPSVITKNVATKSTGEHTTLVAKIWKPFTASSALD